MGAVDGYTASVRAAMQLLSSRRARIAQVGPWGVALAVLVATPAAAAHPVTGPVIPYRPFGFVTGAVSTSSVLRADAICPPAGAVCPLGGGGGIFVGYGRRHRPHREWMLAYDLSVRNARNLFASATLQQFRFDYRWVAWTTRTNFEGFVGVGGGLAVYGETFLVTTLGPFVNVSAGGLYHFSPFFSVGLTTRVEALRFLVPFDTGDGVVRGSGGVATLLASLYLTLTWRGP